MGYKVICFLAFLASTAMAPTAVLAQDKQSAYLRSPSGRGTVIVAQHNEYLWRFGIDRSIPVPFARTTEDDASPSTSLDGSWVAYVSKDKGDSEVFAVRLSSGEIRQLTRGGGSTVKVQGWLNSSEVLYSTTAKSKKRGPLLFAANIESFSIRPIPLMEASEGCVLGSEFIFVKNEKLLDSNRSYRGGYAQTIYKIPVSVVSATVPIRDINVKSTLLTGGQSGVNRNPVCGADGRIYFLSDRSGRYNIWSMRSDGTDIVQLTFDSDFDIRSISQLSATALLYEKLGQVYVLHLDRGVSDKINVVLPRQMIKGDQVALLDFVGATEFQISNDAGLLALVSRGKLWTFDIRTRQAKCIGCNSFARVRSPQISAGGSIYAIADTSGEYGIVRFDSRDGSIQPISSEVREPIQDISLAPNDSALLVRTTGGSLFYVALNTGATHQIKQKSRTPPQDLVWSPDSRYAAFVSYTAKDIGQVAIFDSQCFTTDYLTEGRNEAISPAFSKDSSHIYYISRSYFRSTIVDTWAPGNYWPAFENRSVLNSVSRETSVDGNLCRGVIDTDMRRRGLQKKELAMVAGNYGRLTRFGERFVALSKKAERDDKGTLLAVADESSGTRRRGGAILDDIFDYAVSRDGNAIAARRTDGIFISMRGDKNTDPIVLRPLVSPPALQVKIDARLEFIQMFKETWRLYRDYFWDERMGGVDWSLAYQKYLPFLPSVSSRAELNDLVSHMVSELGAAHTTMGNPSDYTNAGERAGNLGADFVENDGVRIVQIFDGDLALADERSPLSKAEPPLDVGDRITGINGVPTMTRLALDRQLIGKVGESVVVTSRKPDGRIVESQLVPIGPTGESWLRSKSWAWSNRQYVERASESEIGYIRLSAAFEADFGDLMRQYAELHDRKGLILDLRGNNGGNIDPWVLSLFQRRTWLYVSDRHDKLALKHPRDSFDGDLVILIDGDTYSDGELIAEGVRRLGLGTLVGSRTSGAGVWVNDDNALIDGGRVRIPVSGSYINEKGKTQLIIEGQGVSPDILVENDPYEFYFGHDAQLRVAVDHMIRLARKRASETSLKK